MAADEIAIDQSGNCTVFGALAHRLWNYGKGDFPRKAQGGNRYFVLELTEPERGDRWIMRAAQSTFNGAVQYMDRPGRVLVSIS